VADLNTPKTTITGWFAWIAWLFVHLFLLLNYRNQFRTMWNWGMAYFGKARSQGIMVGEYPFHDDDNERIKKKAIEMNSKGGVPSENKLISNRKY